MLTDICTTTPYSEGETTNGTPGSAGASTGDGMIYNDCERPHWRDPMPSLMA